MPYASDHYEPVTYPEPKAALHMYYVTSINHDDGDAMQSSWVMANSSEDACELFVRQAEADAREDEDDDYRYRDYWTVEAWRVPERADVRGVIDACLYKD